MPRGDEKNTGRFSCSSFFLCRESASGNWLFGITSQANSTVGCRQCFVAEFFQVYIVFLVVVIFAKTDCYLPSTLLVRSATCHTSATNQLSTCRKGDVASFQAFHHHLGHETYKHHTSTVTCSERKILPVKTITQGTSQPLVENIFCINIILGHEYTGSACLFLRKKWQKSMRCM